MFSQQEVDMIETESVNTRRYTLYFNIKDVANYLNFIRVKEHRICINGIIINSGYVGVIKGGTTLEFDLNRF